MYSKCLYWNGQLVWTPVVGLYLCVCGDVHIMSNIELGNELRNDVRLLLNVELRNYVISRQIVI